MGHGYEGGYIGVDLDGTLAYHGDTWDGVSIHEPVPAMLDRVKQWLADGVEVRIITARVAPTKDAREVTQQYSLIHEWCKKHLGRFLRIQAHKCPDMLELWDDRAVQVVRDTGMPIFKGNEAYVLAPVADHINTHLRVAGYDRMQIESPSLDSVRAGIDTLVQMKD